MFAWPFVWVFEISKLCLSWSGPVSESVFEWRLDSANVRTQGVQIKSSRAGRGASKKHVGDARELKNLRTANKHKLCKGGQL